MAVGLQFRRADGSELGSILSATAVDLCERVFRGLVGMGFREREARRAIEQLRLDDSATAQSLLRQALESLRRPKVAG